MDEGKNKMKPDDLQKDIVEASNLALAEGMGTDELVITLLSNAVVAASHLGLSKQFCEDQFIEAVDDIYGEEDEECECCEKETHQASDNMKVFFEKLLTLKKRCLANTQIVSNREINAVWGQMYDQLNAIIKEKQ